jgi:ABC-type dipeptide/oligopeptide/nickel transport system permease subunit
VSTAVAEEQVTYWDIVRAQFRKNRPAVVAGHCVRVLVVLATMAPLIAMNVPYVMKGPSGIEWPLSDRLFNRILFPSGVDILFNLLLIVGPVWWLTGRLLDGRSALRWAYGAAAVAMLGLYGVWAATADSVYGRLLVVTLAGIGILGMQHLRRRRAPPRRQRGLAMQTRFLLAALFAVACILLLTKWSRTSAPRDFQSEILALKQADQGFVVGPPVFYHFDNVADRGALDRVLQAPSIRAMHLLGTDNNGRDVLARLLFGTRISLTIGIIAVSIYVTIGVILGSLAGYFGGRVDASILFVLQVMLCIPSMFLLLTIIAVFETRSIFMIMIAIGVTGWTGVARLVRGEFFRQKTIDYVVAARALGIPERRIIFGHILKNSLGPVLVSAAFGVAGAILTESGLSFLGLGDQNAPSWGQLLMDGRNHRKTWLIVSPGLAIFFVVTVLNLVGDGIRDALDPKLRQ